MPALAEAETQRELGRRACSRSSSEHEGDEGAHAGLRRGAAQLRSRAVAAEHVRPRTRARAGGRGQNDAAVSVGAALSWPTSLARSSSLGTTRVLQDDAATRRRRCGAPRWRSCDGAQRRPARTSRRSCLGLLESDWEDVRAAAHDGMVDRRRARSSLASRGWWAWPTPRVADVQAEGPARSCRRPSRKAKASGGLDVHELLGRLAQHPAPLMRSGFAVELALAHLQARAYVRLAKCEAAVSRRALRRAAPIGGPSAACIDFLA
jgi:hypothetical protein